MLTRGQTGRGSASRTRGRRAADQSAAHSSRVGDGFQTLGHRQHANLELIG